MKFLFISDRGKSLSLAQRVAAEGNVVTYSQVGGNEKAKGLCGEGMIRIGDEDPDSNTIVIFDTPGNGSYADDLKRQGVPVVGGGLWNDVMELTPLHAAQVMKLVGMKFPEVPPDGVEVSLEGWFNGADWIYHSLNSVVTENRFLTGGLGPVTSSQGDVVFFYRHARPRLAKDTLFKLSSLLRKANYRGPITVHTRGGYAVGISTYLQHFHVASHLLNIEIGAFLSNVARGQIGQLDVSFNYAVGVTITTPPFPNRNVEELANSEGKSVKVPDEVLEDFHFNDVRVDEVGNLVTAGHSGVVGTVTATSNSLRDAIAEAYKRVRAVEVEDAQYRIDVGQRALRDVPTILKEVSSA